MISSKGRSRDPSGFDKCWKTVNAKMRPKLLPSDRMNSKRSARGCTARRALYASSKVMCLARVHTLRTADVQCSGSWKLAGTSGKFAHVVHELELSRTRTLQNGQGYCQINPKQNLSFHQARAQTQIAAGILYFPGVARRRQRFQDLKFARETCQPFRQESQHRTSPILRRCQSLGMYARRATLGSFSVTTS